MPVLEELIKNLEKQYGKGIIMSLGGAAIDVETLDSGSLVLNRLLGVGGYPKGRIIEIIGPESSGKTTLALHAIASAQKEGGKCLFVDAEHALDPKYAAALGVDVEAMLLAQPDTAEMSLNIVDNIVRSNEVSVIVVDSVASLIPEKELQGEIGDTHVGLQARIMSQAMRKLAAVVSKSHCVLIFINQIREKIGVTFGSSETTPGGRALKFYSSVRIDIRRISSIKSGDRVIGNRTRLKIIKNKVAPPFTMGEVSIYYGEGIARSGELVDLGVEKGAITRAGSWLSYGDFRGQGTEGFREQLRASPEVMEMLEEQIGG